MALKLICMGIREIIFVHIDPSNIWIRNEDESNLELR